jgi:D-alanyl-lipoteichoic acid acyltransferase DltB (MBOAT superfamily)
MLFNSFEYLIFLPVVFFLYWAFGSEKFRRQNVLLIAASYFFYGSWDWRFLFLLIFSTSLDYFTGLKIFEAKGHARRKAWLLTSIIINLGFLGFFKYYNFFIDSFADFLSIFGAKPNVWSLRIILPVGISFYTFHGLSYVIDIYNRKIEPTRNIVDYSLFVCFFPLLVAGPIERATHLLPQLKKPRHFDPAAVSDGLKQILWGLFKKVVVADNCATVVNSVFDRYQDMPANSLVLASILFLVQIYSDFSGYSDIALGSARLFGVELLRNFNYPLFANSMADFWRRNHISMTTWFMDYVYYPMLGDSQRLRWWNFCMIATFLLSGLWHGANWTFMLWGVLHGVGIVISMNSKKRRRKLEKRFNLTNSQLYRFASILCTFAIVCFINIFFRARSLGESFDFIGCLFSTSLFSTDIGQYDYGRMSVLIAVVWTAVMLAVEWFGQEQPYAIKTTGSRYRWQRYAVYYAIVFSIIIYAGREQQFVYFQF